MEERMKLNEILESSILLAAGLSQLIHCQVPILSGLLGLIGGK
jgi:hypothetical protein